MKILSPQNYPLYSMFLILLIGSCFTAVSIVANRHFISNHFIELTDSFSFAILKNLIHSAIHVCFITGNDGDSITKIKVWANF